MSSTLRLGALALAILAVHRSPAAEPRPLPADMPPARRISDDALDRKLFAPESPAVRQQPAAKTQRELQRELGPAAVSEDDDPLQAVVHDMRLVQERLAHAEAGQQTQDFQRRIVDTLDKLLRAGGPSQSKQGSSSQFSPARQSGEQPAAGSKQPSDGNQPASDNQPRRSDSAAKDGEAGATQRQSVRRAISSLWGELPERDRQQVLQQVPVEDFVPEYQALIEAYFRQLAEEQGKRP